jgi:hypothetical protein
MLEEQNGRIAQLEADVAGAREAEAAARVAEAAAVLAQAGGGIKTDRSHLFANDNMLLCIFFFPFQK